MPFFGWGAVLSPRRRCLRVNWREKATANRKAALVINRGEGKKYKRVVEETKTNTSGCKKKERKRRNKRETNPLGMSQSSFGRQYTAPASNESQAHTRPHTKPLNISLGSLCFWGSLFDCFLYLEMERYRGKNILVLEFDVRLNKKILSISKASAWQ